MMAECDPTDGEPEKGGGYFTPESNFLASEVPAVLFEKTRPAPSPSLGLSLNPGAAVRISNSTESVLTELEADGSGEEALLLPGPAVNLSPRAGRDKRTRRNRHSSSSDNLASPATPPLK
ncbi:phosphatidylinositol 4-kinase type 2-beta-like [Sinocyclocheilus rhinocerous]|uniref:phosphatidylinositol 4-kinase type 2-beta-like n=1 Tax=Sinocyclocheilus rhinocerous TaxID=307959 RepID=UPI0007B97729|nr:PREDICTED: phosphatidylinositol 4-kinase type 2-beta-like [Sinocyclocheilus rhinocerous]